MSCPPPTPPPLCTLTCPHHSSHHHHPVDFLPLQPTYQTTLAVKKRLAVLHSRLALTVDAKGTRTPSVSPTTQPIGLDSDSDQHSPKCYPSPGPYEKALQLKQKELDYLRAENNALRCRVRELEIALQTAQSMTSVTDISCSSTKTAIKGCSDVSSASSMVIPTSIMAGSSSSSSMSSRVVMPPPVEVNKKGVAVCWSCWLCDEYLGSSAERVFHSKAFSHRLRAQKAQALRRKKSRLSSDNPFGYMKHYPNGVVSFKYVDSDTGGGEWKIRNIHVTPDMKPPKALLERLWAKADAT